MSVKSNKAVVRRAYEAVSRHDLDAPVQYQSPAYADRWQAERHGIQQMFVAFPDGRWEVEDMVAEGDKVVLRDTFRGTHQGTFMGLPATGKQVTMGSIHIFQLAEGKIVDHWWKGDHLGLMQQLGDIPVPAS
jgi:steroid delta-isomerase-like uncharacterized protein